MVNKLILRIYYDQYCFGFRFDSEYNYSVVVDFRHDKDIISGNLRKGAKWIGNYTTPKEFRKIKK